jgi:hypothetical protein
MPNSMLTREGIVKALVDRLERLEYVHALWEGGAVAFDRLDQWSDIDVCVDAADDKIEAVFPAAEEALASLAPIELKFDVPAAVPHGYVQAFYRLEGTSEFMLVDFAVFKHSEPNKLLEPEIHGNSRFHFNKNGAVRIPTLDRAGFLRRLKADMARLSLRFDTFSCFVVKEINRANWIEAMDIYYRVILGSLMKSLRMRYHPIHYDFRTRYVHYELPPDVVGKLVDLHFVSDPKELPGKVEEAERWFRKTMREIDPDLLERQL